MNRQAVCGRLIARFAVFAVLLQSADAAGQTISGLGSQEVRSPASIPFQIQFDVDAGMAYDDNLFWRPVGTADSIFRVTPTIDMRRETTTLALATRYRVDSERYRDHPELNTLFARQNADIDLTMRPDSRTAVGLRGLYWRTMRPNELNVTTGLAIGRQLASVGEVGAEWTRRILPHSSILAGYTYATNHVVGGPDAQVHSVLTRFSQEVGVRDNVYLTYLGERWAFQPGEPVSTHAALAGWSRRMTPTTTLTLEGGPRVTGGDLSPEMSAALARHLAERTTMSLSYSHTQTVAVGVVGLIKTDRLLTRIAYRTPVSWDVVVSAGAYRNVVREGEVIAYQVSGDIRRALTRHVWLVAALGTSFNNRQAANIETPDVQIRQRSIVVSLHISPGSPRKPRSE